MLTGGGISHLYYKFANTIGLGSRLVWCASDFNAIGMVGCFPVVVTVNVLLACHIRYIVRW